jgi:hypothetical protein
MCQECKGHAEAALKAMEAAVAQALCLGSRRARLRVLQMLRFDVEDCEELVTRGEI